MAFGNLGASLSTPFMQNQIAQIGKGGGGMNPYVMGGAMGLGAIGDYIGGGQQREAQKWSLGQRQKLSNQYQGQMGQGGIDPGMMAQLMALFQQSVKPMQGQLMSRMGQMGTGMGSGEMGRMFNNQMAPMLAGYQGQLGMQNVQMKQDYDMNLRRLLAGLV